MPRVIRLAGPVVLVLVAFLALFAALAFGGGAAAPLLADPGALVRYGLPAAKLIVNLSAAGTIGALLLTCFALSPRHPEFNRTLDVAAASAAVMTVASAITGLLTFVSVTGIPFSLDQTFTDGLSSFVTSVSLGQAWLGTTLIAAAVTVLCFAVRNQTALAFVTALALLSLLPMAQQGHAAGTAGHDAAITALGLHIAFAAIWLGGLLTVVLIRKTLDGARLVAVIERYSTLAIVCFVVVAASGYVSAELRIGTLDKLATPYGILVLVKVAALVALGVFGVAQRRFLIGRLKSGAKRSVFWWLVTAELAFMGIASGVAAALARTATPVAQTLGSAPTPAEILTGEKLPPELTFARYFTSWNFDLLWVLGCGFAIFFYLAGVRRLTKRGDRWPMLPHDPLDRGNRVAVLHHVGRGQRLREVPLLVAHARSHGAHHDGAAAARPRRADHAGAEDDPQAQRRLPGRARMDHARRALPRGHLPDPPDRRGRAVRRLAVGVLLHAAVPVGDRPTTSVTSG